MTRKGKARKPQDRPRAAASGIASPGERARGRLPLAAACLMLVIGVVLVFGQTIAFDWVNFDDGLYIYNNSTVRSGLSWANIGWAFSHFYCSNWHPLTWISHMVDCQIYKLQPGGHHLTNVALHAASACLLLLVLRQLSGQLWMSAFVAGVFAVHPLRAESVAWIAERKDLLSGLLFFLLLAAYINYSRKPFAWRRYWAVCVVFALGLMAKPMLVTAPVVLMLLDYWPLQRFPGSQSAAGCNRCPPPARATSLTMLLLEKLPMAILAAGSGFVTILAQEVAIKSLVKVPLPDRVANALVSYVIYLEHFVVPVNLAAFYPNAPRSLWDLSTIGSLLLILTLSACAWFLRRRVPSLLVGWIWFLVMLLPVIGLLQVGDQAMADRYTYLPMIGPCLLLFQLPAGGTRASPRRAVAAACILTVLLIASWRQTTFWRNSVTLWNRALACTDDNWLARMNLGAALFTLGQTESAIAEFHEAIHLNPQSFQAHNNLGKMCLILHRYDEAIANFQAALSIEEGDAILYTNLGTALRQKGRVAEAVEAWYKALQIIEAGKEVDLAGKLRRRLESYRLGKPAYDDP